jgi:hypothetical protein
LVDRLVWDQEAVRSSRATPTNKNKNNKPHEMKNNEIPQESKELIEMANAYQETGIYEPGEENSGQCSNPEADEWDNIHGDIFLFI